LVSIAIPSARPKSPERVGVGPSRSISSDISSTKPTATVAGGSLPTAPQICAYIGWAAMIAATPQASHWRPGKTSSAIR
jgi:hypothetical protein